jgi:hypothetical protein
MLARLDRVHAAWEDATARSALARRGAMEIETELNQQQRELLEKVRQRQGLEGDDAEVLKAVFLEYVARFVGVSAEAVSQ